MAINNKLNIKYNVDNFVFLIHTIFVFQQFLNRKFAVINLDLHTVCLQLS